MEERAAPTRTARSDKAKELDQLYADDVAAMIKGAMGLVAVDFVELQKRLAKNGNDIAISTLRKKVSNGNCKASFLLQIMDALDVKLPPIKKD